MTKIMSLYRSVSLLFVYNLLLAHASTNSFQKSLPKIGIIGGGVGGTSCAYFLRELFGKDVKIDLFEADDVGGRLKVGGFGQRNFELGGAIIHPKNKYMVDFVKRFNLTERQSDDSYFGLFDGKQIVFAQSKWSVITAARLFWRYGFTVTRINSYVNEMLKKFDRIYKLQANYNAYEDVPSLLHAMDPEFADQLGTSSKTGFKEQGVSDNVIDELIMATIRVNYGQDTSVHKFVGSVSVAGSAGGLWAVEGGNAQVPQRLLEASGARLISRRVVSASRVASGLTQLAVAPRMDIPEGDETYAYDIVVVAAPQTEDMQHRVAFRSFDKEISFRGAYHRTVCTLVRGSLREGFFSNKEKFTDEVFTVSDGVFFNSVSRVTPVNSGQRAEGVWKVFSQRPLTKDQLSSLFSETKDVLVKDWLAYPHYGAERRNDGFVLDRHLYHVNGIEWAASAMEMSVIGAKNVALLALKHWSGLPEQAEPDWERDEL